MRFHVLSLVAFFGAFGVALAYPNPTPDPSLPAPPVKRAVVWEVPVEGHGATVEDAHAMALENARDQVAKWLEDKGVAYRPDGEYLRGKQMVSWPPVTEPWKAPHSGEQLQKAKATVTVTEEGLNELKREARKDRAKGRQHAAALGLAGVVAVLATLGGYLRLESATKGYYTALLRAGVVAALAAAGVGIFLMA